MRFVVTGGGTGGHIYPALAIAKGLISRFGGEVFYLGGSRGMESKIVPREGIEFMSIELEGFRRSLTPANFRVALKAARGTGSALKMLKKIKPRAVIGTGGYVCGPVVLAAVMGGIPSIIHEQNALPGITNRILAPFVKVIMVNFEESKKHFSSRAKIMATGLPLRPEIMEADPREARVKLGFPPGRVVVLSFGGSQGARSINNAMLEVMTSLAGEGDINFLHVTGPAHYDSFMEELTRRGIPVVKSGNIFITPYLYNMPEALAAANLVISRAGATTLAELTAVGLPAILVPYPYASENHQEHNALALERAGAAIMVRDRALSTVGLAGVVRNLVGDQQAMKSMASASVAMGKPGALKDILDGVALVLDNFSGK